MKTSFISSLALQNSLRSTVMKAQNEMAGLQTELTTGIHADVGATLGANTARSLNLTRDIERIDSIVSVNSIATQRLEASQAALEAMAEAADKILATLTPNNDPNEPALTVINEEIKGQFDNFFSFANTSVNGEFLFSGINTDVKPYNDDETTGLQKAFEVELDAFMASQTPPVTSKADLTVDQTKTFMADFESKVKGTTAISVPPHDAAIVGTGTDLWSAYVSSASSTNMTSRISQTETVVTSTNINEQGVRSFALASVFANEFLVNDVPTEVRQAVVTAATGHIGDAIRGLNEQRSILGLSESRVTKANDALKAQKVIVETHLGDLQGVDTYEAKTRLDLLQAQIEIAYSLTSKLQTMSLVNYL